MDVNPPFELDNRSKRSVVLDLTTEDGRATALELIAAADVFLTNIRPAGARAPRARTPTRCWPRNARLVYALITGFGLEGPDADRAAYDIAAFWARSGIADLLTAARRRPAVPAGRHGRPHRGHDRRGHGLRRPPRPPGAPARGQLVTTSLLRQGAYTVGFDLNVYLMWGQEIAIGTTRDHGQPGHEQLRGRRRPPVLDRRPRGRTPLAAAGPRRRPPGVARRGPRVLDAAAAASSTPPS